MSSSVIVANKIKPSKEASIKSAGNERISVNPKPGNFPSSPAPEKMVSSNWLMESPEQTEEMSLTNNPVAPCRFWQV